MQFQTGPQVGTVVGPDSDPGDAPLSRGSARGGSIAEVIGPNTEAGQAFLLLVAGVVILWIFAPKSDRGPAGKIAYIAGAVATVKAADWIGTYGTRFYTYRHPKGPMAAGLSILD